MVMEDAKQQKVLREEMRLFMMHSQAAVLKLKRICRNQLQLIDTGA